MGERYPPSFTLSWVSMVVRGVFFSRRFVELLSSPRFSSSQRWRWQLQEFENFAYINGFGHRNWHQFNNILQTDYIRFSLRIQLQEHQLEEEKRRRDSCDFVCCVKCV